MQIDEQTKDCIDACNACRDECEQTLFQYCLETGGKHIEQKHVQLMADCIEICQAAAYFMLRGSENASAICNACADICEACADSCEELADQPMKDCAQTCRRCAEICREMGGLQISVIGQGEALSQGIMA